MTTEMIDHSTFTKLAEAGAVRNAHIVGQPGGWVLRVEYGKTERALTAQRSQQARVFRKMETLVSYLKGVGIVRYDVDAGNWDAEGDTGRTRPDASVAMKKAHQAAAYNKWLMSEVQIAIDDTSPTIPHEEVVRSVRAAIKKVRAKRAPA